MSKDNPRPYSLLLLIRDTHPHHSKPSPSSLTAQCPPFNFKLTFNHTKDSSKEEDMKWGRKNSPSSKAKANGGGGGGGMSSWISKIKQISGNSKSPPPTKTKQKIKVKSSPLYAAAADQEEEEEAYWRLSFGKDNFKGKKSNTTTTTHVLGSVWFGSDDEIECNDKLRIRVSNHRRSNTKSFTNMVSDVRKTKELSAKEKDRGGEEIVLETPRRKIQKGRKVGKSRGTDRRNLEDVYSDSGRDDLIEVNLEPIKTTKNQSCNLTYSNSRKSHYISSSNLNRIETEKSKKSIDQRRTSSKVRSYYSPRTPSKVEIIKIRAIEEMKKSKLKKKKKEEMEEMEGRRRRGLESCAMVKCSYDPQNDFRESMVEMILEKNIRRSDELEELLACYLTLNSDEYHDLIIKVFKQVWFDLNRFSFSSELENQVHSYSDY